MKANRVVKRQAMEGFETLMHAIPDPVWMKDLAGRFVMANEAFARVCGKPQAAVIGGSANDFFPATANEYAVHDRTVVESGTAHRFEEIVRLADGGTVWYDVVKAPTRDATGAVVGTMGIAHDITHIRRAERALRENEKRLQRILDTVTDGIVTVSTEGRITFVNAAAERLIGAEISSRIAKRKQAEPDATISSPFPQPKSIFDRVMAMGTPVCNAEHLVKSLDGRNRVLSINAGPLRSSSGMIEGLIASLRDVTDARESAQRIQFQSALLEAVGEAIITTDLTGRIQSWNRAAEAVYGWTSSEAIGKNAFDTLVAGEARNVARAMIVRERMGERWTGELKLLRKDGSTLAARVTTSPIFGSEGECVGVIGISHDLTERKQLEEQLREAQKMEAVGRLAGGIAHDFNNLLMVIDGNTTFVLEDLPVASASRKDLIEVKQAAERAASLTQHLLAFSRKQVMQLEVLDLNDVVESARTMLTRVLGEDVELVADLGTGLWLVEVDANQIVHVLMNLAVNARDAMPTGGMMRVSTRNLVVTPGEAARQPAQLEPGDYVVLAVEDNGSGMDEETLTRIFEPFYTTKPLGQGNGLGLSTVYGVVRQSGGCVWADAEPGKGATFHVCLPRVDTDVRQPGAASETCRTGGGETILVVEDDRAVRALMRRGLERAGYRVLEASNGDEALALSESHAGAIDLVVTDVIMPRLSGRVLAERLARQRPGTLVLFVSGYTDDAILRHGVGHMSTPFLQKPIQIESLLERVGVLLGSRTGQLEVIS